jgi:hypothetical protein
MKNERQLYILYFHKDLSALGHPAFSHHIVLAKEQSQPPPPSNFEVGYIGEIGWPRAERSLDVSNVYLLCRFCPYFFETFFLRT